MKRVILFVLVISAALVFSGCDDMLEAFFPNATGGGEGGEGTIEVNAWIDWWAMTSGNWNDYANSPVIVELQKWDDFTFSYEFFDSRVIWGADWIYEWFDWVPQGQYRVVIFYDDNNNWSPDPITEPVVIADPNPVVIDDYNFWASAWADLYSYSSDPL